MRFEIRRGQVVESFWIDAPYDTKKDAQDDLNDGILHSCSRCEYDRTCPVDLRDKYNHELENKVYNLPSLKE